MKLIPSGQNYYAPPVVNGYVYYPRQYGVLTDINDSMASWAKAVKFTIMFDKSEVD